MHLFSTLLTLSLLAATQAHVIEGLVQRASSGGRKEMCGCFSGSVSVKSRYSNSQIGCGSYSQTVCLCAGDIEKWLDSNDSGNVGKNAIRYGGKSNAIDCFADMINRDHNKKQCDFPNRARSKCNKNNYCDYECPDNYVKENGYCKCPKRFNLCSNGSCQNQACPSGVPSLPHKRDMQYWGIQTQKACEFGWKACGIIGGGPRDWECVDVKNDLESCGGCPADILSSLTGHGSGVDCTSLQGVSDVSCISGRCAVHKCMSGFNVSISGHECEEERLSAARQ